jgi:outer membrane biogenesis lipoprotein LolB
MKRLLIALVAGAALALSACGQGKPTAQQTWQQEWSELKESGNPEVQHALNQIEEAEGAR